MGVTVNKVKLGFPYQMEKSRVYNDKMYWRTTLMMRVRVKVRAGLWIFEQVKPLYSEDEEEMVADEDGIPALAV
jgi:hypothetical protein